MEKERKKWNRLIVIGLALLVFVCLPVAVGFGYGITQVLSAEEIRLLLGVGLGLAAFVVVTGGLSLFVVAYSTLRRREQAEDDKRELDLLRATRGHKVSYTVKPQPQLPSQVPMGQPQMVGQRQPAYGGFGEIVEFD